MTYIIQPEDVGKYLDKLVKSLKKKPKFDATDMEVPINVCYGSWAEWCDYRIQKKKPISRMAATRQLELLSKYTVKEQAEIINSSIQNDYQGLFEPKGNNKNGQSYRDTRAEFFDQLAGQAEREGREDQGTIITIDQGPTT